MQGFFAGGLRVEPGDRMTHLAAVPMRSNRQLARDHASALQMHHFYCAVCTSLSRACRPAAQSLRPDTSAEVRSHGPHSAAIRSSLRSCRHGAGRTVATIYEGHQRREGYS